MTTQPVESSLPSSGSYVEKNLSILLGPVDPPLVNLTLGELFELQCLHRGTEECLVTPWTGARWTYNELNQQSSQMARALMSEGIGVGDRVTVMAGNCADYSAICFAVARIGAIVVILSNTYTTTEAQYALSFSDAKEKPQRGHYSWRGRIISNLCRFPQQELKVSQSDLHRLSKKVLAHNVCNLQFTSGTTGLPKVARLTLHNIVNNSRFIGDRMRLGPEDVLCYPPALFDCFGLVLGLMAIITHGGKIVFPGEIFNPGAILRAIPDERCTAVHDGPAMFDTLFTLPVSPNFNCDRLRTGIVAGALVPKYLMELMLERWGMTEFTSSYGLTKASLTCFNDFTDDLIEKRLTTVGTLMSHAHAKIVDHEENIVPVRAPGELCIAGYQLQTGYCNNS